MEINRLFKEFEVPDMTSGYKSVAETRNVISPAFDLYTGDFVLDKSGKIPMTNTDDAWILWCNKALSTERFAHKGYTQNYGIEFEVLDTMNRKSQENWIERTITETLLADPLKRTSSVKDFVFTWGSNEVTVEFKINSRSGMETESYVTLGR